MRKHDDEFKQQTLKKVFDRQFVASVSRQLDVNESLIYKWKGDALENGNQGLSSAEVTENAALKKRIKELEQENESLKQAALIFGRGS